MQSLKMADCLLDCLAVLVQATVSRPGCNSCRHICDRRHAFLGLENSTLSKKIRQISESLSKEVPWWGTFSIVRGNSELSGISAPGDLIPYTIVKRPDFETVYDRPNQQKSSVCKKMSISASLKFGRCLRVFIHHSTAIFILRLIVLIKSLGKTGSM
jgi:hypothetical protein